MTGIRLRDLRVGQHFEDNELKNTENYRLIFTIVGDHVYIIYDGYSNIIVAKDMGNGHGVVLSNTEF